MSVHSKPKFRCPLINRWIHWSSFDVWKMVFEFVLCSIKWCLIHHYLVSKAAVSPRIISYHNCKISPVLYVLYRFIGYKQIRYATAWSLCIYMFYLIIEIQHKFTAAATLLHSNEIHTHIQIDKREFHDF